MKKLICLLIMLSLVLSMSMIEIFAASNENACDEETRSYGVFGNEQYVSIITNEKYISIVADSTGDNLEICIRYVETNPGIIYRWSSLDYPVSDYDLSTVTDSDDIVAYAEAHMNLAEQIVLTVTEENIVADKTPETRSAATVALKAEMARLTGSNQYGATLRYTADRDGNTCRVYESVGFYVNKLNRFTWRTAINVGGLITTILGIPISSKLLETICSFFDVASQVSSIIPAGSLDKYYCLSVDTRCVKINGLSTIYETTDKEIVFTGYADPNDDHDVGAFIDEDSREITYSDSMVYFYSYPSQIDTAYSVFLQN